MIKENKFFIIISMVYWLLFFIYNTYYSISISSTELSKGITTELLKRRVNFLMLYHRDTSYQIHCSELSDDFCNKISTQPILYAKIYQHNHECGRKRFKPPQHIKRNCRASLAHIQFIDKHNHIIDYITDNNEQYLFQKAQKYRLFSSSLIYFVFTLGYVSIRFNPSITIDWKKYCFITHKDDKSS